MICDNRKKKRTSFRGAATRLRSLRELRGYESAEARSA
jgi:hypothetical protein